MDQYFLNITEDYLHAHRISISLQVFIYNMYKEEFDSMFTCAITPAIKAGQLRQRKCLGS